MFVSSPKYEDSLQALRTKTDEEIATLISKLPNDWKVTNPRGKVKTKKDLVRYTWGTNKESDNLTYFEAAILKKTSSSSEVDFAISLDVGRTNKYRHLNMETPRVEIHLLGNIDRTLVASDFYISYLYSERLCHPCCRSSKLLLLRLPQNKVQSKSPKNSK